MTNHFMTRLFHSDPHEPGGEGFRPTDDEYREGSGRAGENCHCRGEGHGPEGGRGFSGPGPHGRGEGHGPEGGCGFGGPGHHGRGPRHARQPDFLQDDSLRSMLIRSAQTMLRPRTGASQELVLRILDKLGAMDQRQLRQELDIQPGSLSELLSKLEQKGLIERERAEDDRRRVTVRLTEAGQAALAPGEIDAEDPFAPLTSEEQDTLRELLGKLLSPDR